MPRVKAVIWDYFEISESNVRFAVCKLCSNDISRGGSSAKTYNTSNLINHLKRDHPVDFKDYEKKKVQELKEKEAAEKNASRGVQSRWE